MSTGEFQQTTQEQMRDQFVGEYDASGQPKFWMVIRPGDCMEGGFYTDKVRYNNFESAKQVAQRVARQLPNYRVVVLESVYSCAAVHSGLVIVDGSNSDTTERD